MNYRSTGIDESLSSVATLEEQHRSLAGLQRRIMLFAGVAGYVEARAGRARVYPNSLVTKTHSRENPKSQAQESSGDSSLPRVVSTTRQRSA